MTLAEIAEGLALAEPLAHSSRNWVEWSNWSEGHVGEIMQALKDVSLRRARKGGPCLQCRMSEIEAQNAQIEAYWVNKKDDQ